MAFKINKKSHQKNKAVILKDDYKNNKKDEHHNRFKRLFFGVGKEFYRITWPSKKEIANNFITIIFVATILAILFITISLVIINYVNQGI